MAPSPLSAQGLPCTNCAALVDPGAAKLFAEVFVCATCHEMATRIFTKCTAELEFMKRVLHEHLREKLVVGELRLGAATDPGEIPKADLLKMIVQLSEKKNARL